MIWAKNQEGCSHRLLPICMGLVPHSQIPPCMYIDPLTLFLLFPVQVNGLPSMQLSHELGVPPNPLNPYTATKYGLMHDMLQILFKPTQVAAELSKDLHTLNVGIKPGPLCDENRHTFCVDYKDLQKLVDSKREYVNRGDYQRIYPSPHGNKYSKLIQHMHGLILKKFGSLQPPRTLWHVHHLYTALERLHVYHV